MAPLLRLDPPNTIKDRLFCLPQELIRQEPSRVLGLLPVRSKDRFKLIYIANDDSSQTVKP
jgi:hypothetical protein